MRAGNTKPGISDESVARFMDELADIGDAVPCMFEGHDAQWKAHISCGHTFTYCDEHKRVIEDLVADSTRRMGCILHDPAAPEYERVTVKSWERL